MPLRAIDALWDHTFFFPSKKNGNGLQTLHTIRIRLNMLYKNHQHSASSRTGIVRHRNGARHSTEGGHDTQRPAALALCVRPRRSVPGCVRPWRCVSGSVSDPGALCRALCRAQALCVSRPGALCRALCRAQALCVSSPGALCVGLWRSACRAPALCVGPRRSVCWPRRSASGPDPSVCSTQ